MDTTRLRLILDDFMKTKLHWVFIGVGVTLRLRQYFFNRSLWLDEAFLAANFIHKDWGQLLRAPMDYTESMTAPVGFMAMAKIAITLLGNGDIVLRLYPLLCSIIALALFMKLAQFYVSPRAVLLSLFLISVSGPLIYQASEFKPYSSDVVFAIATLFMVPYMERTAFSIRRMSVLAVSGSLFVWFSFPSAFLLASIGIYFVWFYGKEKRWYAVFGIVIVSFFWLLSFWAHYKIVVGNGVEESLVGQWLIEFWREKQAFMPYPFSWDGLRWMFSSFVGIFLSPGGWPIKEIPIIFFLAGAGAMLYSKRRQLFVLMVPFVLAAIMSYFRLYPFNGRMLFFLLPAVILMIGEGVAQISSFHLALKKYNFLAGAAAYIILTVLLINYIPVFQTNQEIKPVLSYVQVNRKESDKIYLYFWAEPAFRYYASFYGFNYADCNPIISVPKKKFVNEVDYFRSKLDFTPIAVENSKCVLGVSDTINEANLEFEKLKGVGRVWFIFSHSIWMEADFVQLLNRAGTQLDSLILPGASSYLYEL